MSEQDKKFYATSAFLLIDDLKKENETLKRKNEALLLLLNWAEECDWGFDNFRNDDVVDWEEFENESEDMDYIESMIYYAEKYLKNRSDSNE